MDFYGRHGIYVPYIESDLNEFTVAEILKESLSIHYQNFKEIEFLQMYTRGKQNILDKIKRVRPQINNKTVENNAHHVTQFKVGYVFGDPIQYVSLTDTQKEELDQLNRFMRNNDKPSKDKDLSQDWYETAQGYRWVMPYDNEDKPFIIENIDPKFAFVVYSTDIGNTELFGNFLTKRKDDIYEIKSYTKRNVYTYTCNFTEKAKTPEYEIKLIKVEVNPLGDIPIIEYKLNKNRVGLVELVIGMTDALNLITSSDLDDIEQFVQSLLVFINQEVDKETLIALLEVGAIQIMSNDPARPAKVELLSQKLLHSETRILYDRIYNNMLTICGVPRMTDKASSGDTGQARLIGEGWSMADERAKQDELSFKISDKKVVDLALKICKSKPNKTNIRNLKTSDIEIKFTRNRSDNMMTKAQTLLNLKTANVEPTIAYTIVGLFSDPNEAVKASKAYFGDDFWKAEVVETAEPSEVFNTE